MIKTKMFDDMFQFFDLSPLMEQDTLQRVKSQIDLIPNLEKIETALYTHTVCVPYYKAAPYKYFTHQNFSMAIFTLIFFL